MADDQVANDQGADGPAPDDLTHGVRVCVANLTKLTDELSDAVKVKDEEHAKLSFEHSLFDLGIRGCSGWRLGNVDHR